jgi:hypothetical protein
MRCFTYSDAKRIHEHFWHYLFSTRSVYLISYSYPIADAFHVLCGILEDVSIIARSLGLCVSCHCLTWFGNFFYYIEISCGSEINGSFKNALFTHLFINFNLREAYVWDTFYPNRILWYLTNLFPFFWNIHVSVTCIMRNLSSHSPMNMYWGLLEGKMLS